MKARSERRFQLIDAMLLLASLGLGLALDRNALALVLAAIAEQGFRSFEDLEHFAGWCGWIGLWAIQPFLLATTIATLAIRLRGPRAALSRIRREPGFVAVTAALLSLALCTFSVVRSGFWMPTGMSQSVEERIFKPSTFVTQPGFAVGGAWLALVLVRRWRPQPSWIDRLGRGVGVSWLMLMVVSLLHGLFFS